MSYIPSYSKGIDSFEKEAVNELDESCEESIIVWNWNLGIYTTHVPITTCSAKNPNVSVPLLSSAEHSYN